MSPINKSDFPEPVRTVDGLVVLESNDGVAEVVVVETADIDTFTADTLDTEFINIQGVPIAPSGIEVITGTFVPFYDNIGGADPEYLNQSGTYTIIGDLVHLDIFIEGGIGISFAAGNDVLIGGIPAEVGVPATAATGPVRLTGFSNLTNYDFVTFYLTSTTNFMKVGRGTLSARQVIYATNSERKTVEISVTYIKS